MADLGRWLVVREGPAAIRVRLFCFPYAGGGASLFFGWPASLPPGVELTAAQLPGREERTAEPPIDDWRMLARPLADAIEPLVRTRPYALFGHSLGATLAFEVARHMRDRRLPEPAALVVSGRQGPQSGVEDKPIHHLPDDEFVDRLRQLNATPKSLLDNPELMELVLPRLRADFAAAETYRYRPGTRLECPIVAFGGTRDPDIDRKALVSWRLETRGGFNLRLFEGDHFFIHSAQEDVLASLSALLDSILKASPGDPVAHRA